MGLSGVSQGKKGLFVVDWSSRSSMIHMGALINKKLGFY